ncbi:MAG TPA: hypothetical protein VK922_16535 [Gemmatimonadaceae bacterium]|nr:hypothetical protein [Gemmatimonadaceae bacterium]
MRFPCVGGISLVVLAGLLSPPPALAQARLPTRTLGKPVAEFEEPFTSVGSVRELSNGRVIVSDARDRVVQMLDFASGEATQVGREGQGPGEYSFPGGVFMAPADTTLLYDPLNQRLLLIAPNGKPSGQHALRREGSGPGPNISGQLRGADARGRLYLQATGISMGPSGPQTSDSVPIVRYDRGTQASDTIAFLMQAKSNTQVSGSQSNMRVMVGAANPLAPRDEWAVAPDGRVAVVRPEPYRVEWIAPNGTRTVGPAIAVPKVKVTDADKKAIERQRASGTTMIMTRNADGPGGGSSQARTMGARDLPPLTDWPEYKPPFVGGAAVVAPNGELWVRRTLVAGDAPPLYDVFDARGQRVAHVQLPKGTRLAGFGKASVYLIRTDADDLQYLQKYAL